MRTRRRLIVLVPSPEGAASTAATTVAVGAVACGVCCVLPFALPAVVLASSGGALAMFAQAFWGALYLAAAMVGTAWLWLLAQMHRSGKRPARHTQHDGGRDRRARCCGAVAFTRASPHSSDQGVVQMTMTRRTLLSASMTIVPGIARSQTPAVEQYKPSDPARVGRTGRPQLVEFFHPR